VVNLNTSNTLKPKKFEDKYEMGEELGRGGFSIVKKCTNKETNAINAVKIILKNQSDEELKLLLREIDIMKKIKNMIILLV